MSQVFDIRHDLMVLEDLWLSKHLSFFFELLAMINILSKMVLIFVFLSLKEIDYEI